MVSCGKLAVGAYSRGHILGGLLERYSSGMGAYSRGRLIRGEGLFEGGGPNREFTVLDQSV